MTTTQQNTPVRLRSDTPAIDSAAVADERRMLLGGTLAGLAYLVGTAFVIFFFATSHPAMDASPADAARSFSEAAYMVGVGTWLTLLPLPFALLFLGGLASVLHRVSGWPTAAVAMVAGSSTFAITTLGALVSAITPAIGAEHASAASGAVVKALDGVMPLSVATSGFPRAVLVVIVALALARAGLAGRGLTGFSWVLAAMSILGTATFVSVGMFPLAALSGLLFAAWIASVASILRRRLLMGGSTPRASAA